jgi:hypothetical protein
MQRSKLFRRKRLSTANQSNAQSFVESSSRSCCPSEDIKSPKTLRLGPYYIQVGKRSEKSNTTTRDCKRSELSGDVCRVELPSKSSENRSKGQHTAINEGQISELPAYQFEELPAYDSNMSPTYGYEQAIELEGNTLDSYDFQYPQFLKQDVPQPRRMGHQLLPTVVTSIPSPSIRIDEVESTTPSLASGNSSQIPSPISPLTPSSAVTQSASLQQDWPMVSPISTTTASDQFLVPHSKCVPLDEYAYNYDHADYNSTYEPPFMPPPYQPTSHNMPMFGDEHFDAYHAEHYQPSIDLTASNSSICRRLDYEPPSAEPLRAYERPQWEARRSYVSELDHVTHPPQWYPSEQQPPPPIHQNPVSHAPEAFSYELPLSRDSCPEAFTAPQACSSAVVRRRGAVRGRDTQVPRPPAKRCDICGAEFTGQYVMSLLSKPSELDPSANVLIGMAKETWQGIFERDIR